MMMFLGLLQGCALCALLYVVFGVPEGPGRSFTKVRGDNEHVDYIPWVKEVNGLCVFENTTQPLDMCICIHGQSVVDSWPREDPNPNLGPMHSVPGSNIGR